ncbi:MAG TPA: hypothetical protein VKB75_14115 [Jatrophihabitans sp.]|nr:hypothetical protein [Jatrophihabitans sp.]
MPLPIARSTVRDGSVQAGQTRSANPRRLLVSPAGVAHDPTCRRVPMTAESQLWGEITSVPAALAALAAGHEVPSLRRIVLVGPAARHLCRCLSDSVSPPLAG